MATLQNLNFVPTSIAGCTVWIDAMDASTVSGTANITSVRDKASNIVFSNGNGFSYVSGTYPSFSNGTYATGRLLGSNASLNLTQPITLFATCSYASVNTYQVLFDSTVDLTRIGYGIDNSNRPELFTGGGVLTGTAVSQNTTLLHSGIGNGANSFLFINTTQTVSGNIGSSNAVGFTLGNRFNLIFPWTGTIHEIIIYNSVLSAAQRQQVEGYLAWKWGLVGSLPSGYPYKLIAPNSAGLAYPSALSIPVPVQSMNAIANPIVTFTPTSISNCSIWLDASDPTTLTLTGSSVSQWRDKSANALIFTPPTAGQRPTLTNSPFSRAVSFTTSQTLNTTTSLALAPTQSFFLVFSSSNTSGFYFLEHSPDTNANDGSYFYGGNGVLYAIRRSGVTNNIYDTTVGAVIFSSNTNYIVSLVNSNNGSYIWKVNGTSRSVTNFNSFTTLSGNATTPFYINNRVGATASYPEMLVYNRAVTSSEVEQIEGYLAWKWNMQGSLPSNHPYKTLPPGVNVPVGLLTLQLPILSFQPATFRPTGITGCSLWLDAADPATVLTSGSSLSQWNDKSGNGYNATALTGTTTYSSNAVVFSGSQILQTSLSSVNNTQTVFIIFSYNSTANMDLVGVKATVSQAGYQHSINVNQQYLYRFGGTLVLTGTTLSQNTRYLYSATINGGSTSFIYTNGSQTGSGGSTATVSGTGTVTLGGYFSTAGDQFLSGSINEVILYNSVLSTNNRQSVEGYLAWKWGLVGSLPATHPFKRFPPPPI